MKPIVRLHYEAGAESLLVFPRASARLNRGMRSSHSRGETSIRSEQRWCGPALHFLGREKRDHPLQCLPQAWACVSQFRITSQSRWTALDRAGGGDGPAVRYGIRRPPARDSLRAGEALQ